MAILIETEQPLAVHQVLDRARIREQELEVEAVLLADPLHETVGLGVQAAGVQREDTEWLLQAVGHGDQGHILSAAEGNRDAVKLLQGGLDDLARRCIRQLVVEAFNIHQELSRRCVA